MPEPVNPYPAESPEASLWVEMTVAYRLADTLDSDVIRQERLAAQTRARAAAARLKGDNFKAAIDDLTGVVP